MAVQKSSHVEAQAGAHFFVKKTENVQVFDDWSGCFGKTTEHIIFGKSGPAEIFTNIKAIKQADRH